MKGFLEFIRSQKKKHSDICTKAISEIMDDTLKFLKEQQKK